MRKKEKKNKYFADVSSATVVQQLPVSKGITRPWTIQKQFKK